VNPPTIVFFDGLCGLCNGFVDFLLRHDKGHRLRFAPLQGATAAAYPGLPSGMDTVVVVHHGRVLLRTDAALLVLQQLGGVFALSRVLTAMPTTWRDAVYRVIARHRYRWFGRRAQCRLPAPHEAPWFLP
jgi:predicted DCC family thiol-disulfide oxidoreductase YuxK